MTPGGRRRRRTKKKKLIFRSVFLAQRENNTHTVAHRSTRSRVNFCPISILFFGLNFVCLLLESEFLKSICGFGQLRVEALLVCHDQNYHHHTTQPQHPTHNHPISLINYKDNCSLKVR